MKSKNLVYVVVLFFALVLGIRAFDIRKLARLHLKSANKGNRVSDFIKDAKARGTGEPTCGQLKLLWRLMSAEMGSNRKFVRNLAEKPLDKQKAKFRERHGGNDRHLHQPLVINDDKGDLQENSFFPMSPPRVPSIENMYTYPPRHSGFTGFGRVIEEVPHDETSGGFRGFGQPIKSDDSNDNVDNDDFTEEIVIDKDDQTFDVPHIEYERFDTDEKDWESFPKFGEIIDKQQSSREKSKPSKSATAPMFGSFASAGDLFSSEYDPSGFSSETRISGKALRHRPSSFQTTESVAGMVSRNRFTQIKWICEQNEFKYIVIFDDFLFVVYLYRYTLHYIDS